MKIGENLDTNQLKDTLLNFIVPLVALAVAIVLIFAVILPQSKNLPVVQEELVAAQSLEGQLRTKLGVLNKLLDFRTVVDENASLFERALVDAPLVPELLTQVDQIAKEAGLTVDKLSYSITDVGGASADDAPLSYKAVIVNLGATGSYDEVTTFLGSLEGAARLADITTYRFSSENSEDPSEYSATFILRSPYLFVESTAVTDASVTVDISDPAFLAVLEDIKGLRFYNISVDEQFLDVEESDIEEVEETEAAEEDAESAEEAEATETETPSEEESSETESSEIPTIEGL